MFLNRKTLITGIFIAGLALIGRELNAGYNIKIPSVVLKPSVDYTGFSYSGATSDYSDIKNGKIIIDENRNRVDYIDSIEVYYIDHRSDIKIFTNSSERNFCIDKTADFKVYGLKNIVNAGFSKEPGGNIKAGFNLTGDIVTPIVIIKAVKINKEDNGKIKYSKIPRPWL